MQSLVDISQTIPSNKFYPPRVDNSTHLLRSSIITDKLGPRATGAKIITIEAQAGQGKSMVAAQYLDHFDLLFAWYQVGSEDADPVLLLSALLENFQRRLPGFESLQLSKIVAQGEIGPLDLSRCINILLSDLDKFLADDFYLVFDDIHLIEEASLSKAIIDRLIDTAPPQLHFIFISRRPLTLSAKTLRYSNETIYLDNDDLSLSREEMHQLFDQVLKVSLSEEEITALHIATAGWIMGIILAVHPVAGKNMKRPALPRQLNAPQLLDYFRNEIFVQIPEQLQQPLLQLSFLDELSLELARKVTGCDDIGTSLATMMQANFFVYPLDDDYQVFRFHHLFREFLQHRAVKTMSQTTIQQIHQTAAAYYLEQGALEKALACYATEKNYSQMEEMLKEDGFKLLARNRTFTLLTLLTAIPTDQLFQYGWLTLFCGLAYADYHPQKSLPILEAARKRFSSQGEKIGELLALGQIIYFHFVVSGRYHIGSQLLPRTEKLLVKYQKTLPINARVMVTRHLAAGYCFFNGQMEFAYSHAKKARELAIHHDIRNGIASTRFICGYVHSLTGNPKEALQEIELFSPLINDPLVGMSNKLTLRILQLHFLTKYGDVINFDRQQNLLRKAVDNHVVEQTVAAPYLYVWGCTCLITIGRYDRAHEMLLQGSAIAESSRIPHMKSQFLQWQGYLHAIHGIADKAIEAIEEAGTLRAEAGGPFYETLYEIIAGASYSRLGKKEQALNRLNTALSMAEKLPSEYLVAATLFHRSWFFLMEKDNSAAKEDLRRGLQIMARKGYQSFWSWEPVFILELLKFANRSQIEPSFVDQLARQRLGVFFTEKDTPVPLLSFSLLGPFTIAVQGKTVLKAADFTPAQRTLLSLLITSPGQKLDQETIQATLWPDSPPDKIRAKFDTLLVRTRKALATAIPVPVKHFLVMKKGILSLANCTIDMVQFEALAKAGLRHAHAERYWQAGNAFNRALILWKGPLETDRFMASHTMEYTDRLITLLTRMTNTWAAHLAGADCPEEAIEILKKTIRYNQMSDRLIGQLYRLYLATGNPLKARETLINYRQTLREMGLDQHHIDDLLLQLASKAA